MWSFFRSKSEHPPTIPALPHDIIEGAILSAKGDGVHFAVLYANMLGYRHETLSTNEAISDFLDCVQREPDFDDEGIAFAVSKLISDLEITFRGDFYESFFYGLGGLKNRHLKEILDPFKQAVSKSDVQTVLNTAEFDLASLIVRVSTERRRRDLSAIFAKLDEKRVFLAPLLMRAQAQGRNKYGDLDYSNYFRELSDFVLTYFSERNLEFFYCHVPLLLCHLHVQPWLAESVNPLEIPENGIDFEHWCAARLKEQGWSTRVSNASGDQGVDIEAMRDGIVVAVQCKRYANAVGNAAVQEAHTGAVHYRASKAVVIATGGFTRAATDLAETSGVILLDAENIAAFTSLVTGPT